MDPVVIDIGVAVTDVDGLFSAEGMINSVPTESVRGFTSGFAARSSSKLTPYRKAIANMVSPATIEYDSGVGVGEGGTVGVAKSIGICEEISLGVGLKYGIKGIAGVIDGDGDIFSGPQPANPIIRINTAKITPFNERS